ncbi:hypothetical protein H2O64_15420 [Kordia sp. YSTF-M3]|uniref:DUF6843 domain-containing protein n=1 Tax=Kordia aestuariivivens TaxID=2759037 RepID=A0ABR7QCH2_9FLAO|nr:hypothetical protein [Kordia aestuariivivens]MBC8756066.1 hypothetical protein [Kordia aestuariivivens]
MEIRRKVNRITISLYLIAAILMSSCFTNSSRDIYILPDNYEGCVLIVFDVKKSSSKDFDNQGNRIFYIPNNGILESQFKPRYGTNLRPKFYYKNDLGLKELDYIESNQWNNDIEDSTRVASTLEYGENLKPWRSFIVGKFGDQNICSDRHKNVLNYFRNR